MSRPYPKQNPFPYQGTLSIEGTDANSEQEDPSSRAPTLTLDPVKRALRLTKDYVGRFSVSEKKKGQFVVFRGDHGSGKTHSIYYVMDRVEAGALRPAEGIPTPLQLYAKAEGPQFLDVYGRLMKQVSFDVLHELSRRFLGVMVGEQLGDALKDEAKGREAAEKLRLNPDAVGELFRQVAVEKGAVEERQAEMVDQVAGRASSDFRRVMSFLPGTGELARSGYEWLTGRTLAPDDMKKLGVSGPISSPEVGKWAVQLLAGLFRTAGRPLIIYLDQYEKLVLDKDHELATQNIGRLHSLVEVIPRENGMLVLSGNEEAWGALSPDFRQRFADNVVLFPILTVKEARQVVCVYLIPPGEALPWEDPAASASDAKSSQAGGSTDLARPAETTGRPFPRSLELREDVSEDDLCPFTSEAVASALEFGSGNIRRFLQICASVFDKALPEERIIGPDLVNQVLQENRRLYTRETVAQEIEEILRKRTLPVQHDFDFEGVTADFAVLTGGWGSAREPRLLVQISKALFSQDEANKALGHVNLIEKLHNRGAPTRFVLVVLGYASPEVTKMLAPFVHDLVVYRADKFRSDFEKALDRMPRAEPAISQTRLERDQIQQQLSDLRKSLQDVLETRKVETSALEKRLEDLLSRQEAHRASEKRPEVLEAWLQERRHIEEQIRAARIDRQKRALEELEGLRAKAESDRGHALWLSAAAASIAVTAFTWGSFYLLLRSVPPLLAIPLLVLAAAAGAASVPLADRFRDRGRRELAAAAVSREDLDRLARAYLGTKGPKSAGEVTSLLHHPNPHLRYVGVLAVGPFQDPGRLVNALLSERCSIVRQLLARQIGALIARRGFSEIEWPSQVKEYGYILEELLNPRVGAVSSGAGLAEATELTGFLSRLPRSLQTLAVIIGGPAVSQGTSLAMDLAAMLAGRPLMTATYPLPPDHSPEMVATYAPPPLPKYSIDVVLALSHAYQSGFEVFLPLSSLTEGAIRDPLGELSPFEEGGLGTLDDLRHISEVDQLYLFFRQVLFRLERGFLGGSTDAAKP